MVFSSMIFLWIFLPLVLILYWGIGDRAGITVSNGILLFASLLFYSWGEPVYVFLMIFSAIVNYLLALAIDKKREHGKLILAVDIVFNVCLIGYFKYFDFFAVYLNAIANKEIVALRHIMLPLGISFYTFQIMSYVIDVYRNKVSAQKNFLKLLLYISLFPQLIAGPIVRYADVERQLDDRCISYSKRVYGIKRFIIGLSKKVLLANYYGDLADKLFGMDVSTMSTPLAWVKMLTYALDIYYDFSGYSDMAIGLGAMFGFDFNENFNYPYISKSIQEFWRRWHISLSTWFKEYVYIPLGGNRKGRIRTYINLIIIFALTGFWHGASLRFVAWGLFFGAFLVIERMGFKKALDYLDAHHLGFLCHIYTAAVVMSAWTFFRELGIREAVRTLKVMFVPQSGELTTNMCINTSTVVILVLGILLAGVLQSIFPKFRLWLYDKENFKAPGVIIMIILFGICVMRLVSESYNAFIYFRF